jgi:hypothetical protein
LAGIVTESVTVASPLPILHMFIDDAGTTPDDAFVVGIFCTQADGAPEVWCKRP